jgi:23S rRNA (guanosine2251-2'-O)-methyltransferase
MRKLKNQELNRITAEQFKATDKTPVVIILDNVRSLNNIGSIFRTADAFLLESIYLCGITACPPHKDIQKTALGATETVSWKYFKTTGEAVSELRKAGYRIYAVEQTTSSLPLHEFTPVKGQKTALVFGHEVNGVDEEIIRHCDDCIEVPQYGSKHSLNIAVCAGIVIWDIFQKLSR